MTVLRRLGYWQSTDRPELPDPCRLIDPDWNADERQVVASYFRGGTLARAYLGPSTCRICGSLNGSTELSDGWYLWPEGLAHYIEEHLVRLPQEAREHALLRVAELEDAEVDESWWLRATSA